MKRRGPCQMLFISKTYPSHTFPNPAVLHVIGPSLEQCYSMGENAIMSSQRLFPFASCLHCCYNSGLLLSVWLAVLIYHLHVWIPNNLFLVYSPHHSRNDHNLFEDMNINNSFLNQCAFTEQLLCSRGWKILRICQWQIRHYQYKQGKSQV